MKMLSSEVVPKNIFAQLFSVHNIKSLSRREQVCLMFNKAMFREILFHHQQRNSLCRDV